jgi:hypothetical protein
MPQQAYTKDRTYRIIDSSRWHGLTSNPNPVWSESYSTPINVGSLLSGFRNSSWRSDINRGLNATSTLEASVTTATPRQVYCRIDRYSRTGPSLPWTYAYAERYRPYGYGFTTVPSAPSTSLDAEAYNLALVRLYKRIREQRTSFEGLTFVGELREALSMIRNPARTLRNSISGYLGSAKKRARRNRSPAAKNRAISQTWLEYSFGWSPLINDVGNGAKALSRLLTYRTFGVLPVSARDSASTATVTTGLRSDPSGAFRTIQTIKESSTTGCHLTVGIKVEPYGNRDLSFLEEVGFNPGSFLPTLWELLPWSFFIDYFTNVGDVIGAFSYLQSEYSFTSRTYRRENRIDKTDRYDMSFYPTTPLVYFIFNGEPGDTTATAKRVSRGTFTPGIPTLDFRLPGFGTKWLNIAALVRARGGR